MNLISYLCHIFECYEHELYDKLKKSKYRKHAERVLAKKELVTNYRESERTVRFDGFSRGNAWTTMAFNGYLRVRVQQYFYVKYEIELNLPRLPLAVQMGPRAHRAYYPLELLRVVKDVEDEDSEMYHRAPVTKSIAHRPPTPMYFTNRRMCASSCDEDENIDDAGCCIE